MHLVTTAHEEFINEKENILLLGDWCIRLNKKDNKKINYKVAAFQWDDVGKIESAYKYCNRVYEKSLSSLCIELNKKHKINMTVEFYEIILGDWLNNFIHQYYDKYIHIKNVKNRYNLSYTIILDRSQYYIPVDYGDYSKQKLSDTYNLQMYSDIIRFLNIDFQIKKVRNPILNKVNITYNGTKKARISQLFSRVIEKISSFKNKKKITIVDPYFKYDKVFNKLFIILKSNFKCIFDDFRYQISIANKIDSKLRGRINLSLSGDEFEVLISKTTMNHIPTLFLENFILFSEEVKKLNIKNNKYYYTAQSLHSSSIFKFFLAYHRNKIKLFTHQHGGNYGIDAAIFSEYYERKLSDVFYTWGWGSGNCKILSPPRMKFRKKSPSKRYFLYASHDAGRYLGEFKTQIFSSIVSNNYLKDAELFVKNVNHKEIIFRFKPSKREGDFIKQSFLEMDPNIKCSCNNEKFENMLSDCELFIADHLITTWLESLTMNKPTVVFTNKKYFKCRRSVEPIIKRLVDVGTVFFDPIAAAKHVNNISNDIDKWWGNENLQSVKNEFVANYAYSSHNWRLEWIDEFNTIMKKY